MAWTSINTSIRAGSLVRYSDIGAWLNTASSNASTMNSRHCASNYTGYNTSTHSVSSVESVYSGQAVSNENSSVRYSGFRKCGGEYNGLDYFKRGRIKYNGELFFN